MGRIPFYLVQGSYFFFRSVDADCDCVRNEADFDVLDHEVRDSRCSGPHEPAPSNLRPQGNFAEKEDLEYGRDLVE